MLNIDSRTRTFADLVQLAFALVQACDSDDSDAGITKDDWMSHFLVEDEVSTEECECPLGMWIQIGAVVAALAIGAAVFHKYKR